jgi:hypothetical protein
MVVVGSVLPVYVNLIALRTFVLGLGARLDP